MEAFQSINFAKNELGPGLDIKWNGYVVMPSGDGAREWVDVDGQPVDFASLNFDPPELPEALVSGIRELHGVGSGKRSGPSTRRPPEGHSDGEPREPLPYLEFLLFQLDVLEYHRQGARSGEWIQLLMAVHYGSRGHVDAREMFVRWSMGDPDYKGFENDIRNRWESFAPDYEGGVGVGTLVEHVKEAGGDPRDHAKRASHEEAFRQFFDQESTEEADAGPQKRNSHRSNKAQITLSGAHHEAIVDKIVETVVKANDPKKLFLQGDVMTRLASDDEGNPILRPVAGAQFSDIVLEGADFYKIDRNGNSWPARLSGTDAGPAYERTIRTGALPSIRYILEHPIVRKDGSVLVESGYDTTTRLYAAFGDPKPRVPERPSNAEVERAVDTLKLLFQDFPLKDTASLANTLAIPLTLVMTEVVDDSIPMFAATATTPATGKTKLLQTAIATATGSVPALMPDISNRSGDELRKAITSLLLSGRRIAFVDNIKQRLESSELEALLTARVWNDRWLSRNKDLNLPNQSIWFATGNNLQLGHEMFRRSVMITLDAEMAHPERRSQELFHHILPEWALGDGRQCLLEALLTLCRAWFVQGQPGPSDEVPAMGSFERWRHVVGGVLEVGGVKGFLANATDPHLLDPELAEWAAFLSALYDHFGSEAIRARDVRAHVCGDADLRDLVPSKDLHPSKPPDEFSRELGGAFKKHMGRLFELPNGNVVGVSKSEVGGRGGVAKWIFSRVDADRS